MALQGDLDSFALPDVLRLLAATAKSGRLDVAGSGASGEVWFEDGSLAGGEVTSSPHASRSSDVVFELLRFDQGTFRFDEGSVPPDSVERTEVEAAIADAEALLEQWAVIERVVPSVHSWVELADQIETEAITLTADQWRLVASISTGATARVLGDRFEMTDLEAMGRVKELVELGVVEVGDIVEVAEPEVEATDLEREGAGDDVYELPAEDRPVVLEDREDALLPEPLPGEGTSYVGDIGDLATVDGRFAAPDAAPRELDDLGYVSDEAPEPIAAEPMDEPADDGSDLLGDPIVGEADDPDTFVEEAGDDIDEDALDEAWSSYGSLQGVAAEAEPEADELAVPAPDVAAVGGDDTDDRGSLLRFLSSVKP